MGQSSKGGSKRGEESVCISNRGKVRYRESEIIGDITDTRGRTTKGMSKKKNRTDTRHNTTHEGRVGSDYEGGIRGKRVHMKYNMKCS
jgi:hypothetical protein